MTEKKIDLGKIKVINFVKNVPSEFTIVDMMCFIEKSLDSIKKPEKFDKWLTPVSSDIFYQLNGIFKKDIPYSVCIFSELFSPKNVIYIKVLYLEK